MIGERWKNITDGNGIFFNCNQKKDQYSELGIGIINYHDTELREALEKNVAGYLTKTDYYARMIAPDNGRTFFKGVIKTEPNNIGRPREHVDPTKTLTK